MRKGKRMQSKEGVAASLWSSPAFHFTTLFLPPLFFSSFPRPTISSPPSPFFVGSPAMERRRDDTAGKERPPPKREELPADDDDDDEDTPTEDERRTKRPVAPSARKAGSGGAGGPACQVERCSADLSAGKRYHRRHKVCEHHAKAAVVVVAGLHQRFCQQCSRFHELSEFDETKRSCRLRLAGHNERRRKNSSETQGESSGRKGGGSQLKENHCRQGKISLPPGANLKDFQIR